MPLPPQKYKFDGFGKWNAIIVMRLLVATGWGVSLTTGLPGKITYWILKRVGSYMASYGVVLGNIGIERVEELIEKGNFDDSLSDEIFSELAKGVTPERGKEIDDKVIDAFDKFITFGKLRDNRDS